MIQINIRHDVKQAERMLGDLVKRVVPQATARSLNEVLKKAESRVVKDIAKTTAIKQATVRRAMRLARATWSKLRAELVARGKAMNLIHFTKQTRESARKAGGVIANAWGKRRFYKSTFIANQGRTVFLRMGKGRSAPIRSVWGPSVPREMERERVQRMVDEQIRKDWPKVFSRNLKYFLGRATGSR